MFEVKLRRALGQSSLVILFDGSERAGRNLLPVIGSFFDVAAGLHRRLLMCMNDMETDHTAAGLRDLILHVLEMLKIDKQQLHAFTTDSTSVNSGPAGGACAQLCAALDTLIVRLACAVHVLHLAFGRFTVALAGPYPAPGKEQRELQALWNLAYECYCLCGSDRSSYRACKAAAAKLTQKLPACQRPSTGRWGFELKAFQWVRDHSHKLLPIYMNLKAAKHPVHRHAHEHFRRVFRLLGNESIMLQMRLYLDFGERWAWPLHTWLTQFADGQHLQCTSENPRGLLLAGHRAAEMPTRMDVALKELDNLSDNDCAMFKPIFDGSSATVSQKDKERVSLQNGLLECRMEMLKWLDQWSKPPLSICGLFGPDGQVAALALLHALEAELRASAVGTAMPASLPVVLPQHQERFAVWLNRYSALRLKDVPSFGFVEQLLVRLMVVVEVCFNSDCLFCAWLVG